MNTLLLPIIHDSEILFRPFIHHKLSLQGRIVFLPASLPLREKGIPHPQAVLQYKAHTSHRPALIITEPLALTPAPTPAPMPAFYNGAGLREWKRICRAVHTEHCKFAPQLFLAAEPEACHNISNATMAQAKNAYARAAAQAYAIGADALVLHAGKGSLIHQFLRADSNTRTDEYGGDPARRARFAGECILAIRKNTARHFPIIIALSQWDAADSPPLAATPHELEELLQALSTAGVDAFLCHTPAFTRPAFPGNPLTFAAWVRLLSHKPTIAELTGPLSSSSEFADILRLIHSGKIDLIAHRPVPTTP